MVLTGGPCGGKSSSLEHLTKALTANGFDVLCVPEVTSARGAVEPMRRLPIRVTPIAGANHPDERRVHVSGVGWWQGAGGV